MFEPSFSFYKLPNQKVMVRVSLNLQKSIVRLQCSFPKSRNRIVKMQCPFPKSRNRIAEVQCSFPKSRNRIVGVQCSFPNITVLGLLSDRNIKEGLNTQYAPPESSKRLSQYLGQLMPFFYKPIPRSWTTFTGIFKLIRGVF